MDLVVFFSWLVLSTLIGVLAHARGRGGVVWFVLGCLFSPLLMFIFLMVKPNLKAQAADRARVERDEARHREQIQALTGSGSATATESTKAVPAPTMPMRQQSPEAIASELERLSVLVDKGRLTMDEFNDLKVRLLGRVVDAALVATSHPAEPDPLPALEATLNTPERCIRQLKADGCSVTEEVEGVWEVLKPNGVTSYARTFEVLKSLALQQAAAARAA